MNRKRDDRKSGINFAKDDWDNKMMAFHMFLNTELVNICFIIVTSLVNKVLDMLH